MCLTGLEDEEVGGPSASSPTRKRTVTHCIAGVLVFALLGCFMLTLQYAAVVNMETRGKIMIKQIPVAAGACGKLCEARLNQRRTHHGGDYLTNDDLLQLVQKSRDQVVDDLKNKYGEEHFAKIFESSKGKFRETFVGATDNGPSMKRFQRKLQMKILEVQAAIYHENTDLMMGCNCNVQINETGRHLQKDMQKIVLPSVEPFFSHFVWSTAGHSAAAGHGNLHNESYTAFMEQAAKPVYDAIGIELIMVATTAWAIWDLLLSWPCATKLSMEPMVSTLCDVWFSRAVHLILSTSRCSELGFWHDRRSRFLQEGHLCQSCRCSSQSAGDYRHAYLWSSPNRPSRGAQGGRRQRFDNPPYQTRC